MKKIVNLDGIKSQKTKISLNQKKKLVKVVKVDSIVKRQVKQPVVFVSMKKKNTTQLFFRNLNLSVIQQRVPLMVAVVGLLLAFGAGSLTMINTPKSIAETAPQVLGAFTDVPSVDQSPLPVSDKPVGENVNDKIPNSAVYNLSMDQLENYLTETLKTPELKLAEILALRKQKLKVYLAEKNSPFVDIVDTLAELKHWQLVLAISNSESTLGKRCYNNNCSGIGVKPGHPLWRDYSSKAEWAKDLDRLIEKRYKDWTLDEMNGVYNKPGSDNWAFAATQILNDLKERDIE